MHKGIVYLDGLSEDYLQAISEFISEWESQETYIRVNTSGSTGAPKELQVSKENVRISARNTGKFFNFSQDKNLLLALSPHHIAGKLMIVRALEFGCTLYIAPNKANPLDQEIPTIDFAAFVPYQIAAILQNETSKNRLKEIKTVLIGGAPLSFELERALVDLPNECYVSFGMTETITHFALRKVGEDTFQCLQGFKIGTDSTGRLILLGHPYSNEPIETNDCIEAVSETTFRWLGRLDNVINSGGVKIYPEQLERQIQNSIPKRRFYVSSRAHPTLGQQVVLVVEGNADEQIDLEELRKNLSRYHVPAEVIYQPAFQETVSGKVVRQKF